MMTGAFSINPIENHRERENGSLIYPVYSRRSSGLSIGINLFPQHKSCLFNCPYCEVFPFSSNTLFSLNKMEDDLRYSIKNAHEQGILVKDICFSGNGEPSLSPDFPKALERAVVMRNELIPSSEIVLITNGTGLLTPKIFSLLKGSAAGSIDLLNIWLKLDAGTSNWHEKINCSNISFEKLIAKIKEFISCAPVTIQTMLCTVDGAAPTSEEVFAWEHLLLDLSYTAKNGTGHIKKIQLYGKARTSPHDPKASTLPLNYLNERAASLHKFLSENNTVIPVEVYL